MAWDDMADVVNVAVRNTFGQAVTYTPQSTGVPESIVAPFDNAYDDVQIEGGTTQVATRPVLELRLADLSVAPAADDAVTVDGVDYEVTEVRLGGNGDAKAFLVEVASP